jgi:DNA-binding response OmpR family regulator
MSDGPAVRRARTVAVIEDDPDIRWLLEELAQDAGFEVQMYDTYDEAFMRLAAQPVNAIIADCIDCGYITPTESDRARLAELASLAPIILHTARPLGDRRHHCCDTGRRLVGSKPTDFSVLLAALEHAFREH